MPKFTQSISRYIAIFCLAAVQTSHAAVTLCDSKQICKTYSCEAITVDSGVNNAGKSINGYLNDNYSWYDNNCQLRSMALARNDNSKGGNAKQFSYTPVVGNIIKGSPLTINPGDNSGGGFGYIVAHLANPSLAYAYGKDDSPLGSANAASYQKVFVGAHHAIHQYTLNYVRYGLTKTATSAYLNYYANNATGPAPFLPWDWLTGTNDPNRKYVTAYNMPVTIQWMVATGRNYPLWTVTFDLSQAPDYAVYSDFRAPYGDMKIEGGAGSETVGGVGWGDIYQFVSSGNPLTMNNAWDYSIANLGAPYDYLWTSSSQAEMGLVGTMLVSKQNAGGYNNGAYSSGSYANGKIGANLRGSNSAKIGGCKNDQGAGPGYTHLMPCMSDWAYQLNQYSYSNANTTTSNKRLAWGADWGSLGYGQFTTTNGKPASGWPKVSYSVFVVLDNHVNKPSQHLALQAQTINQTKLSAALGSVLTSGPAGVGRTDSISYSPVGYSAIYGTWEVNAVNNQVKLNFTVNSMAPTSLDNPILVVHNYTANTPPNAVQLDGVALVENQDYFLSLRPEQAELWVSLKKSLAGSHKLEVL